MMMTTRGKKKQQMFMPVQGHKDHVLLHSCHFFFLIKYIGKLYKERKHLFFFPCLKAYRNPWA